MNFTTLRPPPPSQAQRVAKEGAEKDAEFLLLRLLNKRSRVRISSKSLPLEQGQGKTVLFAIANETGIFAAVAANEGGPYALCISPLSSLRSAFASTPPSEGQIPLTPQRAISLPGIPSVLSFALRGQRILVGLRDGQIVMYDAHGPDMPLHVFPSPSGGVPQDIQPNPEGIPELAAVFYVTDGSAGTSAVQIIDVQQKLSVGGWVNGGSPETTPTSIAWSPKGKQLALGLLSGHIVTFSPTDTNVIKTSVPRPSSLASHTILSLAWLSNSDFYAIYVPAAPLTPDSPQTHMILTVDGKANTSTEIIINAPCAPFPGVCLPGAFPAVLRQWTPTKFLVFVGDSCSSDIGLIGCEPDAWAKFTLEETSTPTVPLDEDMNDTVLMGLAYDLTGAEPFQYKTVSGEDAEAPPPPVLYAYASDGTIVGWHVVNTNNNPYPAMASPSSNPVSQSNSMDATKSAPEPSPVPQPAAPVAFSPPSAFAQAATTAPAFGQPAFGQTSTSAFGQSSFGQPSAFGQTSLGSTTTSSFGQPSFGGASVPKTGFGAFASAGPAAWAQGTSAFGSNALAPSTSAQTLASPMAVSNSASGEDAMAADTMADAGLGGLSLGGGESMDVTRPSTGRGTTGVFGALPAAEPPKPAEESKPAGGFGAFGALKPSSGFGAFGGANTSAFGSTFGSGTSAFSSGTSAFGGSSAFGGGASTAPSTSPDPAKPASAAPAFGKASFGSAPAPAFGQSSFGQSSFGKPSFGQASFGSTGFGATANPAAPSAFASTTNAGFGAFASGGTSAFGAVKSDAGSKPAWATGGDKVEKKPEAQPVFGAPSSGGFGAFAQGGSSAFSIAKTEPTTAPTTAPTLPELKTEPSQTGFSAFSGTPSPFSAPKTEPVPAVVKVEETSPLPKSPSPGGVGSSVFGGSLPPKPPTTLDRAENRAPTPPTPSSEPSTSVPPSPAPTAATPVKDASSATPTTTPFASSPFKSTTPGPSTGAFSNLVSNTGGFSKLDSGFGAFGGGLDPSSPFYKPPAKSATSVFGGASTTPTTTPKSVFGSQASPSSAFGSTTSISAFGSPSPLGASSSVFGKPPVWGTTPKATPPASKPVVSAFSAFSGSRSGLSAFSGGGESSKSFSDLLRQGKDSPEPVKAGSKAPLADEDEAAGGSDLSFVEEEEAEAGEGDEDETGSFLSQSFSEESLPGEEQDEEQDEVEEEEEEAESQEQTPKPELPSEAPAPALASTPSIQFTSPSPPASPEPVEKTKEKIREASTTPPGSPAKQPSPPPPSTSPPTAASPTTPAIGLGRPSTRPTRSSPLASKPISGEDEEGEGPSASKSTSPASAAITPQLSKGSPDQLPSPSSGDEKSPVASQPKTPPILSTTPPIPKLGAFSVPSASPQTPASGVASPAPAAQPSIFSGVFTGFGQPKAASPAPTMAPPAKGGIFSGGFTGFGQTPASPSPPPSVPSAFTPPSKPQQQPAASPGNIFALKASSAPTPFFGGAAPSAFSLPPKPSTAPATTSPALGAFGFGQKSGGTVTPSPLTAPTPPKSAPSVLASAPVAPAQAAAPAKPQETLEGMQQMALGMYQLAEQELKNVKVLADEAAKKRDACSKATKITRTRADIGDASKWAIADAHEFARVLKGLENDIAELKSLKAQRQKLLRELESSMLRAMTRKEEIVRFQKASTDAEFAKVLKSRTLGPEHLETQTQLRRSIRVIRDRVQTLEDHLQAAKKRLNQFKTGKPAVRAPTLDTINRTYRNIDLAISQQAHDIAQLTTRVSKLNISDSRRKSASPAAHGKSKGERRMPEDSIFAPNGRAKSTPPRDVTPNVAATTAAALNAERAAQKLKRALLNVRKTPLLNTQAVHAQAAAVEFKTPHKADASASTAPTPNFEGLNFSTFTPSPAPQTSTWTLPPLPTEVPDTPSPPDAPRNRLRTQSTGKHHQKAPALKATTTSPTPATTFDWGPLPGVKPKTTISIFDLGKK